MGTAVSKTCSVGACLNQVAGTADFFDADAELAACQSIFGFPAVITSTITGYNYFETVTSTSTYTDVIVTTSTVYSTEDEFTTSYQTDLETATAYTTTVVNTVSTTVSPAAVTAKKRAEGLQRRSCKPRSTTAPAFALPTDCPSVEEYASACACLLPSTYVDDWFTSTTTVVETATVTATSEAVVTEAVTTVVVVPVTTTETSTLLTLTQTTTTATATASPSAPTVFGLVVADGTYAGTAGIITGTSDSNRYFISSASDSPTQIQLTRSGYAPVLLSDPTLRMRVNILDPSLGSEFNLIAFTTDAYATGAFDSVTCSVDPSTLLLSCLSSGTYIYFKLCSLGGDFLSVTDPSLLSTCSDVQFKAVVSA